MLPCAPYWGEDDTCSRKLAPLGNENSLHWGIMGTLLRQVLEIRLRLGTKTTSYTGEPKDLDGNINNIHCTGYSHLCKIQADKNFVLVSRNHFIADDGLPHEDIK